MSFSAVVFDLDGTLVDLPIDYERMFAEFRRIMKTQDIRSVSEKVAALDDDTRKKVCEVWDRFELAVANRTTPRDEGMKLYRQFSGKRKALVTMQGKRTVPAILQQFSLSFDAVVTREDSLSRVEQLKMASEKLAVPIPDILFIGDADSDAAAAGKVRCQFLRVKGK